MARKSPTGSTVPTWKWVVYTDKIKEPTLHEHLKPSYDVEATAKTFSHTLLKEN